MPRQFAACCLYRYRKHLANGVCVLQANPVSIPKYVIVLSTAVLVLAGWLARGPEGWLWGTAAFSVAVLLLLAVVFKESLFPSGAPGGGVSAAASAPAGLGDEATPASRRTEVGASENARARRRTSSLDDDRADGAGVGGGGSNRRSKHIRPPDDAHAQDDVRE